MSNPYPTCSETLPFRRGAPTSSANGLKDDSLSTNTRIDEEYRECVASADDQPFSQVPTLP